MYYLFKSCFIPKGIKVVFNCLSLSLPTPTPQRGQQHLGKGLFVGLQRLLALSSWVVCVGVYLDGQVSPPSAYRNVELLEVELRSQTSH